MKTNFTLALSLLLISFGSMAQNQITTPAGQPLIIGNQGVKHASLTSASATQPSNGKVLTVDATGLIILAPDAGGGSSQWTTSSSNIYFNTGNVGVGTTSPLQRLDVNGDINIPTANSIRINNIPFIKAPGTANTIVGSSAGTSLSSGGYNVFVGSFTGQSTTTGGFNLFLGSYAGQNNTTGANNFFGGVNAGKANTTGFSNSFIGTGAGTANTTGALNTFIGPNAGRANTTASFNFFAGVNSGYNNVTGARNLFLGYNSGFSNTSGNDNVFVGGNAGDGITTGSGNIFLGYNAKPAGASLATLTNSAAIGNGATVTASNSIVLGASTAKVGIGVTAPSARLHIDAASSIGTGVRFENLADATGTIFKLYVDASGNVLKSSSAGAREDNSGDMNWSLTSNADIINSNSGGVIIGTGLNTAPKGYKLYVADGILTEKVKVAVKNTSEWSDFVFDENYKFPNLEEVGTYIQKNKHLPGVPSASEMVTNGNDLHKTDAILLQKIEELTLYMLELNKENQSLKERINKLEKK